MAAIARGLYRLGVPPSVFRHWNVEPLKLERSVALSKRRKSDSASIRLLSAPSSGPPMLPMNISRREELSTQRYWWYSSMREAVDRPARPGALVSLPKGRVLGVRKAKTGSWNFSILDERLAPVGLPKIGFYEHHRRFLYSNPPVQRTSSAYWFLQNSCNNYSMWLRASLPKLLWLKNEGVREEQILLLDTPEFEPNAGRTDGFARSFERLGMDLNRFQRMPPGHILHADELRVLALDPYPGELLADLRDRLVGRSPTNAADRRIFISRSGASRRRLVNEDEVFATLLPYGFEQVCMETLAFDEQVELMSRSEIVLGAHGAGMTNLLFCPPAADLIEILDRGHMCPNFFLLARALGHRYWLLSADPAEEGHHWSRHMRIDPKVVSDAAREAIQHRESLHSSTSAG